MADKVIVSCKLPHGLVIEARETSSFTGPNGEQVATYRVLGKARLRGSAEARATEKDGVLMPSVGMVVEGYGLTEIDKGLWEAWAEQNKDSLLVKNLLIFASPKLEAAKTEAREQGPEITNGMEPLNPDKPEANVEPLPENDLPKVA